MEATNLRAARSSRFRLTVMITTERMMMPVAQMERGVSCFAGQQPAQEHRDDGLTKA